MHCIQAAPLKRGNLFQRWLTESQGALASFREGRRPGSRLWRVRHPQPDESRWSGTDDGRIANSDIGAVRQIVAERVEYLDENYKARAQSVPLNRL